jgi:GNAT superfamily N-acetyltransferase
MDAEIRRLDEADDFDGFSCGVAELDNFIRTYALPSERVRSSTTFVAAKDSQVVGFATVTANQVYRSELDLADLPPFPLPVLCLMFIGVHEPLQNQGIGSELIATVLAQAPVMAEMPGCLGVILDSRSMSRNFYERLDFQVMKPIGEPDGELVPMFLSLQKIRSGLGCE